MSFSKQVSSTFQKEFKKSKKGDAYDYAAIFRNRVIGQRKKDAAVVRLDGPTNIPRARSLGYKAKQGVFVVLVRVRKGSGLKRRPSSGRKPKQMGISKLTRRISRQSMAEIKASAKYPNCEVLNSYWVGEDGLNTFYEVILVDVNNPVVKSDKSLKWISSGKHRGRAERGKTSSARKSRGLKRGKGHEKNFPSLRAKHRLAK
jgi:large subunit ribosomal protein L15e